MKEYWTDEDGAEHKILFDGKYYYVDLGNNEEVWLEDEDVFDEDDYPEEPLTDEDRWDNECDKRCDEMRDEWFLEQRYA